MKIPEVAERKLVPGFRIFGMRFLDPEIPFAIFSESVDANEFVLCLRRRMMISPRIFLINDRTPLSDQFLCKSERGLLLRDSSAVTLCLLVQQELPLSEIGGI